MTPPRRAHTLDVLAAWEPSFQQISPDAGRMTLPHVPGAVSVRRDPFGWYTLTLPLPPLGGTVHEDDAAGFAAQLLEAHHRIIAPVKFAREHHSGRYLLLGEVGPGNAAHSDAHKAMFMGIREGLAQGMTSFGTFTAGKRPVPHREGPKEQAEDDTPREPPPETIREQLAEFLRQRGHDWSQHETGFLIALDTERYFQKIDIHLQPKGVIYFQSQLTAFTAAALSRASRQALTAFLLNANSRLRLARASIIGSEEEDDGKNIAGKGNRNTAVVLEVATSAAMLSPTFTEQALSSLIVGARFTTLEVQALCDEDVAQAYLHVNREGR
jgi:hypothetical protein